MRRRRPREGPLAYPTPKPYVSPPPPPDLRSVYEPGDSGKLEEFPIPSHNGLSVLHHDILDFVKEQDLSEEEVVLWEEVRGVIEDTCEEIFGERAIVRAYGSHACGLSTRQSDLDLVILNILKVKVSGYTVRQKAQAVKTLYTVAKRLVENKELRVSGLQVIPSARIPLLKITTEEGVQVDLTVFTRFALDQAAYIRKALVDYPAARPVCIIVKALLKKLNLDGVVNGGLGGYSIANMVIAHCQVMRANGEPDVDYGDVLIRFFQRYHELDFSYYCVTIRHEGVLAKLALEKETKEWIRYNDGWQGRLYGKRLLLVEDPLSGNNIAAKTRRYSVVQRNFGLACKRLLEMRHSGREHEALDSLLDVRKPNVILSRAAAQVPMTRLSRSRVCCIPRSVKKYKYLFGSQTHFICPRNQLVT